MKFLPACIFGASLLVSLPTATSGFTPQAAARDVSVSLFSTRPVRAVTITPAGSSAWIASCLNCNHKRFAQPVHFARTGEIFAGGMLRVVDDQTGETKVAAGLWHLRVSQPGGAVDVVLTLPSERYVAGVLNSEAAPNEPAESLRALAILARTYALNGRHFSAPPGHLPSDLCDSTQCQGVRLGPVSPAIEEAVQATAGETLWFGPRRAEVFFSQSCGGLTEEGGVAWPKLHGLPYLPSRPDPYCLRRGPAAWHTEVSLAEFAAIARAEGWRVPERIVAARVAERSQSHRALRLVFSDGTGAESFVAASALRFGIGRALGWNRVRSDAYDLGLRNGALMFDGHGHGHGVGLCQAGAAEMAAEGKDAKAILSFYFPGTAARMTPDDEGWQEIRLGAITLRSTLRPASEEAVAWAKLVEQIWSDALAKFPPRKTSSPNIVLAPTTELFRQMTAEPGWMLASTRGHTIVLQPKSVLASRVSTTLLHEMLHVLVEAEASRRAPLWLREGLVEVLAGEANGSTSPLSTSQIDSALTTADSWDSSERAHRAAGAKVRLLVARYGVSTVRSWLSSGPPADAL